MAEIKPVRVFQKDQPCTKVEIMNCFNQFGTYVPRPVVETRGEIGLNVPKYLLKNDFARDYTKQGIDYLELTKAGIQWLEVGLARYLELHPEREKDVLKRPPRAPTSTARTSRTAPPASAARPIRKSR